MSGKSDLRIAIESHSADAASDLASTVNELYRSVFLLPPFNATEAVVDRQRENFPKFAERPGFRLTLARCEETYVGFGYGCLLPADSKWWSGVVEPLDADFTRETGHRTFAIIDYGVVPEYRHRGIGGSIHSGLLKGSGAERATLSVRPSAEETQTVYRHWGWRRVGHEIMDPPIPAPVFDILVLDGDAFSTVVRR